MLQSMGSQRVGHDWATNTTKHSPHFLITYLWNYCVCQLEVLGQQADDCIPFPNPAPSDTVTGSVCTPETGQGCRSQHLPSHQDSRW